MRKLLTVLVIAIMVMTITNKASCEEITIGTLRDFKPILEELKTNFEKKNPEITINFIVGKEDEIIDNLQLQESPIDIIFLDNSKLIAHMGNIGVIKKNSIHYLAKDQLCMIVKKSIAMRAYMLYPQTLVMNAVAISNPNNTALGKYTKEALTNLGLYEKASKKLLFFDSNINITSRVASGDYDGGIAYCSFAKRSFVRITDTLNPNIYSKIIYTIGIRNSIKETSGAYKFNDYLKSAESKAILKKFNLSY